MERHQHMRSFISAAAEYTKHPSEATATVLQRNLGALAVSMDLAIFDPGTSIATEYYVKLHELMSSLGSGTLLIWNALDALQNACRNTSARQALIHTYKFAPILTRLLETNLTPEKRVRVLKLLQEFTYGVKLSWQESNLPYLIGELTQWIMQSTDEDVVALSLGILVNLCYKNLPALYTLMRTVDLRTFFKTLIKIQSCKPNTSVQCCKMMIILESTNKDISAKHWMEFVTMMFGSLETALKDRDILLLRHIVDFFDDIRQNEHSKSILLNYENYPTNVEKILLSLDSESDSECVARVMEFLLSLVSMKLAKMVPLYPLCANVAMTWIPDEKVCSKALALIRTVLIDSRGMESSADVLEKLDLSILMLVTDCDEEKEKRSAETESRLTELMQLLQEMTRIPALKVKVIQTFGENAMRKLLKPMLEQSDTTEAFGDWATNWFNDTSTTLYVHAIALTADLASHDSKWLTLYTEILQKRQTMMVMALALYTGNNQVKQKVLQLTCTVGFSQECTLSVARCMSELAPLILVQTAPGNMAPVSSRHLAHGPSADMAPPFSFYQETRLDAFLTKLEDALSEKQIGDITTSAVMELYDYKLEAMRRAERATQASLEAANNHVTSLQHRLAQVVAESSRLHQLLFHSQQCLEGLTNDKLVVTKAMSKTINDQSIQIQEIPKLKKIVNDKSATIERLTAVKLELEKFLAENTLKLNDRGRRIIELESELQSSVAKSKSDTKKLIKLQESLAKKEQTIEKQINEIASNQQSLSALKQEVDALTQRCLAYQQEIDERRESLQKKESELADLSRMRDMIFQLTAKKNENDNNTTT